MGCRKKELPEMADDLIRELVELEKDVKYQEYAGEGESEYCHIAGSLPILISAPHGAAHTRDRYKEEDEYTAGLARLVGEKTGAHVLYARRKSKTDPNADLNAPYKKSLEQIIREHSIKFVVDLHGANPERNFGVAIGTMHGKSCSEKDRQTIISVFTKHGISEKGNRLFRLDNDNKLPAEGDNNREPITKFCHRISVSAAQLEINAHLRIPSRRKDAFHHNEPFSGEPELITILVNALTEIVTSLSG